MGTYEKIVAMWKGYKLETAADIDRVLDNFKTSFAFQSGRLSDPQITYHDTVSIFERDSVNEYTGVVRSLLEQRYIFHTNRGNFILPAAEAEAIKQGHFPVYDIEGGSMS